MNTFFAIQQITDTAARKQAIADLKAIPLFVKLAGRAGWERWHAHFGEDSRFPMATKGRDVTKRYGRNMRWNKCDVNAHENAGVAKRIYDYIYI